MRARRHTCLDDLLYLVERRQGALITRMSTSCVCACVYMTLAQKAGEKLEASCPQGTQVHPESESTSTSVCVSIHVHAHMYTSMHMCIHVCVYIAYMCRCVLMYTV